MHDEEEHAGQTDTESLKDVTAVFQNKREPVEPAKDTRDRKVDNLYGNQTFGNCQ